MRTRDLFLVRRKARPVGASRIAGLTPWGGWVALRREEGQQEPEMEMVIGRRGWVGRWPEAGVQGYLTLAQPVEAVPVQPGEFSVRLPEARPASPSLRIPVTRSYTDMETGETVRKTELVSPAEMTPAEIRSYLGLRRGSDMPLSGAQQRLAELSQLAMAGPGSVSARLASLRRAEWERAKRREEEALAHLRELDRIEKERAVSVQPLTNEKGEIVGWAAPAGTVTAQMDYGKTKAGYESFLEPRIAVDEETGEILAGGPQTTFPPAPSLRRGPRGDFYAATEEGLVKVPVLGETGAPSLTPEQRQALETYLDTVEKKRGVGKFKLFDWVGSDKTTLAELDNLFSRIGLPPTVDSQGRPVYVVPHRLPPDKQAAALGELRNLLSATAPRPAPSIRRNVPELVAGIVGDMAKGLLPEDEARRRVQQYVKESISDEAWNRIKAVYGQKAGSSQRTPAGATGRW